MALQPAGFLVGDLPGSALSAWRGPRRTSSLFSSRTLGRSGPAGSCSSSPCCAAGRCASATAAPALAAACADGAPAAGCATVFGAAAPLRLLTGGEGADRSKPHELWSVAPVFANDYALLGELAKVVRVSALRFLAVEADASAGPPKPNLVVRVAGFPNAARGENVTITLLAPGGVVRSVSFAFAPGQALAVISCSGAGAASVCAAQVI